MSIASEIQSQMELKAALTELVNEHGFIDTVNALALVAHETARRESNQVLDQLAYKLEELL